MKPGISIKEISKEAGVSIATVSRVINKKGRYSKETEERVMRIIRENHYEPNLVARGLRVQKMKNVGIIVPDITNEFFVKLVYEIEKCLFAEGYESFLCNTNEDENLERKRTQMMTMQNACGLIFLSGGTPDMSYDSSDLPMVFIDRFPKEVHENFCMISSDNIEGGYIATKELLDQGCKNILLVTSRENISVYTERFEGYIRALMQAGMDVSDIHVTYLSRLHYQDAYDEMNRILDAGEFCYDGVFAEADWLALGCYKALVEHGLRVPEQVKIVGFDDISITAFNAVPITTVRQQVDVIGKLAAEHLLRIINEEEIPEKVIRVPVFLVPRESTRGKEIQGASPEDKEV